MIVPILIKQIIGGYKQTKNTLMSVCGIHLYDLALLKHIFAQIAVPQSITSWIAANMLIY